MKELDENHLRSWRPRRTSAGLRRKLFGGADSTPWLVWEFSRLAPAAVCLLFAMMTLHFGGGNWRDSGRNVYANFTGGSNTIVFSDRGQEQENHLANITFDWTNKGVFQSSIGSHSGLGPSTNASY
jgi:hypothetical protein